MESPSTGSGRMDSDKNFRDMTLVQVFKRSPVLFALLPYALIRDIRNGRTMARFAARSNDEIETSSDEPE